MSDNISKSEGQRENSKRARFGRKNVSEVVDGGSNSDSIKKVNDTFTDKKENLATEDKVKKKGKEKGKAKDKAVAIEVPAKSSSENRREIPVSCYDLLNGSFRKSARTRTISVVVSFAVLFGTGYLGLTGVVEKAGTSKINREISALQAEKTELLSSFGESTGLAGVSETDLLNRDQVLTTSINAAVGQQPDLVRIVKELQRIANPEITVRTVTVGENLKDPRGEKDVPVNSNTDENEPVIKTQRIMIIAESENFDLLINWAEQLRSLSLLADVVFSRSGKSVQIDAKFGPGSTPDAALELLQLFGSGAAGISQDSVTSPSSNTRDGESGNPSNNTSGTPITSPVQPSTIGNEPTPVTTGRG
jgi:hypothetical protein